MSYVLADRGHRNPAHDSNHSSVGDRRQVTAMGTKGQAINAVLASQVKATCRSATMPLLRITGQHLTKKHTMETMEP